DRADHPSCEPRGALRRPRIAPLRWATRGGGRAGRRADARHRGARVRLAHRDRGLRRPPPDDPAAQRKGTMTLRPALLLASLAPAVLPAQEPRDTVILTPVVVTATRIATPADAVTGVVQIFTRRGVGTARAAASVGGGTYGTRAGGAEASGGSDAASYALSVSRFTSDGVYAFNNRYTNTVVTALVRAAPDARTDATLSLRYGDDRYHFPTNGAGVPGDHNQFNYGSGPTLGLEIGRRFGPRFETRLLLAASETEGGLDNRPDSAADQNLFRSLDHLRRPSARVRATAGAGFREPTFSENYSTGYSVGNPDLKPEHSRSWELGLEQSLADGRASVAATFFDQRFLDLVDYDPGAAAGASNYANVAAASANGVELGVRVAPAAAVSLAASYTYLHTDVTNPGFDPSSGAALAAGQPLLRRPEHSARLDARYRVAARGTVSLGVTYVGKRVDQDFASFPFPRVELPDYTPVALAGELEVVPAGGVAVA